CPAWATGTTGVRPASRERYERAPPSAANRRSVAGMASFARLSADPRGRIASKLASFVQAPTVRHARRGQAAIMKPARDEQRESEASRHRHRDRGALQRVAVRFMTDR